MTSPEIILRKIYESAPDRCLSESPGIPMFDTPSVAIASADDPWFQRLKTVIGPFHWTPQEAMSMVAPGAKARSVIVWTLPVCEVARTANRAEAQIPSHCWALVRTFGDPFIKRLGLCFAEQLRAHGLTVAAPQEMPENKTERQPGVGMASRWSARHVAFVAGLGTFGISGGLITRRGIAHRLGSLVTDAEFPVTQRPYGDDPYAWCLRVARGTCGACIQRCPSGSVGEDVASRDKDACMNYVRETVGPLGRERYSFEPVRGCGLCQTGVPCEHRNPTDP